jgi:hypothetical protein
MSTNLHVIRVNGEYQVCSYEGCDCIIHATFKTHFEAEIYIIVGN